MTHHYISKCLNKRKQSETGNVLQVQQDGDYSNEYDKEDMVNAVTRKDPTF